MTDTDNYLWDALQRPGILASYGEFIKRAKHKRKTTAYNIAKSGNMWQLELGFSEDKQFTRDSWFYAMYKTPSDVKRAQQDAMELANLIEKEYKYPLPALYMEGSLVRGAQHYPPHPMSSIIDITLTFFRARK